MNPRVLEKRQLKKLYYRRLPPRCKLRSGVLKKVRHWHDLKEAKNPGLKAYADKCMDSVIDFDCDLVADKVDIIIVLWDRAASDGSGTQGELTLARFVSRRLGRAIKVYCVEDYSLPYWLERCTHKRFKSMDKLKKFLKEAYGVKDETT